MVTHRNMRMNSTGGDNPMLAVTKQLQYNSARDGRDARNNSIVTDRGNSLSPNKKDLIVTEKMTPGKAKGLSINT